MIYFDAHKISSVLVSTVLEIKIKLEISLLIYMLHTKLGMFFENHFSILKPKTGSFFANCLLNSFFVKEITK